MEIEKIEIDQLQLKDGDIELKVVRKESQDHPDITLCH